MSTAASGLRARSCLKLLCSALASAACVGAQEVLPEAGDRSQNHPPTFDPLRDVAPMDAVVCASSVDAAPVEFRLERLQDADGDRLEARWFIDYAGGFSAVQKSQFLDRGPADPAYPAATLSATDIDPYHRSIDAPFAVEVVVSDGFDVPEQAPRNRAVKAGAYAVTYRWTVVWRSGAACD
ncbi:MAG: hypothetical protein RL199_2210 [Pseudomonadota bacterium]|jgi:hypothetical protein